jgi:putative Holliday junction resolvase
MNKNHTRVLAIDPGSERIGVAISDQTATIANPLMVIKHVQREIDAEKIKAVAMENSVCLIVVGQALYIDGQPNPSGRKSARLAEAIKQKTEIPVVLWDEHESTKIARETRKVMKTKKKKYHSHMDELAATIILQSYLDSLPRDNHIHDHALEKND